MTDASSPRPLRIQYSILLILMWTAPPGERRHDVRTPWQEPKSRSVRSARRTARWRPTWRGARCCCSSRSRTRPASCSAGSRDSSRRRRASSAASTWPCSPSCTAGPIRSSRSCSATAWRNWLSGSVDAGASIGEVRGLLLRRNAWLAALGALHGTLLYFGDFLGAYGLVGMAAAILLVNRSARVLRAALWIWGASLVQLLVLTVVAIAGLMTSAGPPAAVPFEPVASLTATSFASSVVLRLHEWPRHTLTVLPFIMIVWLGIWAACRSGSSAPGGWRLTRKRSGVCSTCTR